MALLQDEEEFFRVYERHMAGASTRKDEGLSLTSNVATPAANYECVRTGVPGDFADKGRKDASLNGTDLTKRLKMSPTLAYRPISECLPQWRISA
jgi:hypothetical protein